MSLAAFRSAVTGSHAYARELWVCDSDGTKLEAVPLLPGSSLQVSAGLVRRSASVQIPGDARWIPRPGGLIWWDHPLLFRFGADGLWWESPLLWPDEPEYEVGGAIVTLGCYDALRIVSADSKLAAPLTFLDGSAVASAFRALLVATGAPDDPASFDLLDGGASFSGDHVYEAGSTVSGILGQWQVDHLLDLWARAPAVYTLRPQRKPLMRPPVATWARGREVRLLGFRKRYANRAKNHAVVEGLSLAGVPFRVEVFDLNHRSPVRFGSPGVPDLVIEWQSDGITTEDQAEAVGRSLLIARAVEEEIEAMVPVDPSLERGDVVRIEDPDTDTVGTFALDEFPVPAAPGGQSITVRRERALE